MQESKSLHYVLGAALALIAVFVVVALVMINSQATDTNTSVTIDNVAPTVVSIYLSNDAETGSGTQLTDDYPGSPGTINSLVAGSTKNLFITGIVEDTNGAADITTVSGTIRETIASGGFACSSDENDCYQDATCDTFAGPTTDQLYYSCGPFSIAYYADSTSTGGANPTENWVVRTFVDDGTATGNSDISKEMQTLLSLNIPTSINYGTLALAATTTTANDQELVVEQYGNDEADVEVSSAAAMTCSTRGSIPVASQEWSLTSVAYASGTDLSGTPADTNLNVGYRTGAAVTQTLFWGIGIPSSGVEGTCTGTTVITAIAH